MLPNFFDIPAPVPIVHKCPNCNHQHTAEPPNGLLAVCKCGELIEIYEQGIYWWGKQAIPPWAIRQPLTYHHVTDAEAY